MSKTKVAKATVIVRGVSTEGKTPICEMARQAILKGKNFQETYAAIKKAHIGSKFSKKCYYWFRNHLRKGDYNKMYGKKVKVPALAVVKK